jgi:anti-anti-sigma factor
MISDILGVRSGDSARSGDYLFHCTGCIDVRADPVLEVLRKIPPNSRVLLDFKQVERVNSMGLSLLLKIFQEWKKNGISVEVYNLNKMVGILFKITGLGGYVISGELAGIAKIAAGPVRRPEPSVERQSEQPAPAIPEPLVRANTAASPVFSGIRPGAALRFAANINNSFHRGGWFAFTTYLQRQLKTVIRFEQCVNISELAERPVDLFFANPYLACSLMRSRQLIPVARTDGSGEQAVILADPESKRLLSEFAGGRVAVSSRDSLVFLLGRQLCDRHGLHSSALDYSFAGNEIKTIQNLIKKRADLAFISRQTFEGLSSFSRNSVSLLLGSQVSFSHPLFCIGPQINGLRNELQEVLLGMSRNEEGRKILNDIRIDGWHPGESVEIDRLGALYGHYLKN